VRISCDIVLVPELGESTEFENQTYHHFFRGMGTIIAMTTSCSSCASADGGRERVWVHGTVLEVKTSGEVKDFLLSIIAKFFGETSFTRTS
jgi:hypothetical protein